MDTFAIAEMRGRLFIEVLQDFGEARLAVTGTSMLPAVWPGDILTVRRQGTEEIRRGEIVLLHHEGRFIAHRVLRTIRQQGQVVLLTSGDRLKNPDPPVAAGALLGRVTAIERGRRRVNPRPTLRGRLSAWVLGRSELATRLLLRLQKAGHGVGDLSFETEN